jgi:hypothetical protein
MFSLPCVYTAFSKYEKKIEARYEHRVSVSRKPQKQSAGISKKGYFFKSGKEDQNVV